MANLRRASRGIAAMRVVAAAGPVKPRRDAGSVENMWKKRGSPVDLPTAEKKFALRSRQSGRMHRVDAPSAVLSLAHGDEPTRISLRYPHFARRIHVKRIEQVINGREYHIEVSHVA